jgi:hypothetical protein
MGKFHSNLIPKRRPPKSDAEIEAAGRAKLERMVILSDRARSSKLKVSLPKMSWETSE